MLRFNLIAAMLALPSQICGAEVATVTIKYPSKNLNPGAEMFLRGDGMGLNWTRGLKMTASAPNTWSLILPGGPLTNSSLLQFKSLVDDNTWQVGANEMLALGPTPRSVTIFPWFGTQAGKWRVAGKLTSSTLNNTRSLAIYMPPSYEENTLKVFQHVLIMHDGQNLFSDALAPFGVAWKIQDTLDQQIIEGNMQEIVVVGVYNTENRNNEYTYSYDPTEGFGGDGDLYLDFLEAELIPWIGKSIRCNGTAASNLAILGSSLGGLISCYAGWTRPAVYGKSGCMSSSFWWNSFDFNSTVLQKPHPSQAEVFYLDSGDSDSNGCKPPRDCDDRVETIDVRERLQSFGWLLDENLFYYLQPGGVHDEASWGARFHVPMTNLFPPLIQ